MSDDTTPESKPDDAYPPPSPAYPNQNNTPPADPPVSNPYGANSPPSDPYGTAGQTPQNPSGGIGQAPQSPYGTPNPSANDPYHQSQTGQQYGAGYSTPNPQSNWPPSPVGPYDAAGGQPYTPVNGTMILTLGILSFFCAGIILGPIAWVMGNNGLKTLDQYGDPLNQRGNVSAGRICGMVGTILSAVGIVFYIIYIVFIIGVAGFSAAHPS